MHSRPFMPDDPALPPLTVVSNLPVLDGGPSRAELDVDKRAGLQRSATAKGPLDGLVGSPSTWTGMTLKSRAVDMRGDCIDEIYGA